MVDFHIPREVIQSLIGANQQSWARFVTEHSIQLAHQNLIIAFLEVYGTVLEPINVEPQRVGPRRLNLVDRYLNLQYDPDFLREEVQKTRRYMLARESREDVDQNYGLVVGRIQSGKTAHMLGLIMACIENQQRIFPEDLRSLKKTRLVILFTSLIEDIRKQTLTRLNKCLPAERLGSMLIGPDETGDFATNDSFLSSFQDFLGGDSDKEVAILVLKKNHDVIVELNRVLAGVSRPHRRIRDDVLIIDDECDYGSQDANNADQNQTSNETAINFQIRSLIHQIKHRFRCNFWYIGYTATPYCNVLMYPSGISNNMPNLFPRGFITTINQHPNHFDNSYYFSTTQGDSQLSEPGASNVVFDELNPVYTEFLTLHILSRLIKLQRMDEGFHHTSMINSASTVQEHVSTLDDLVIIKDRFIRHCRTNFAEFSGKMESILVHFYSDNPNLESFLDLFRTLSYQDYIKELNAIKFIELNRRDLELEGAGDLIEETYPQEIPYPDIPVGNQGHSYVVTGGARISRGLTLEGLTISLFTRRAQEPNYDTMLQMSRWCGYRKNYGDLVKLLVPEQLIEDFQHINEVEEQLRRQLNRIPAGADPSQSPIWIMSHEDMNPSGKMPNRDFIMRATTFSGGISSPIHWAQQPVDLQHDISNIQHFNRLFNQINSSTFWNTKADESWDGFFVSKHVSSRIVERFLRKYSRNIFDLDEQNNLDRQTIGFIEGVLGQFPQWNVAVASPMSDQEYVVPGSGTQISLSIRTPNSRGFIQRIYSNYSKSIAADGLDLNALRTTPLLLIYLIDTTIKHPETQEYYYKQHTQPSVQIGLILPEAVDEVRAIDWLHGQRDGQIAGPNFEEE
jgi:hypothetical protein